MINETKNENATFEELMEGAVGNKESNVTNLDGLEALFRDQVATPVDQNIVVFDPNDADPFSDEPSHKIQPEVNKPEYEKFEFLHNTDETSGAKLYFVQVPSQQAQLCLVVEGLENHPFIYDKPSDLSKFRDDALSYGVVIDEAELKSRKKAIQNSQSILNSFKISVYDSPIMIHQMVYGTYNKAVNLLDETSPYIAETKEDFIVGEIKPGNVRTVCFKWKTKIGKSEAIAFTKPAFLAFMNGYSLQEISEMDPEEPISGDYTYADVDDAVRQLKKEGRIHTNNSGSRLDVTLKVNEGYFDKEDNHCTRLTDEKFVIMLKK